MNSPTIARYHTMSPQTQPKYDDIVDRTDFKKGQDKERAMRLVGDSGGSTTEGAYDFNNEEVNFSKVTGVQLALRSGRLDKADIDTLKRAQDVAARSEQAENREKLDKAKKDSIDNARQAFMDSKTGFNPNS